MKTLFKGADFQRCRLPEVLCLCLFGICSFARCEEHPEKISPNGRALAADLLAKTFEVLEKNSFKNVSFDFTLTETTQLAAEKEPQRTYWSSGKTTLAGQPGSLIKVSYSPSTTIWEDGASPYLQEEKSFAFNGKYWLTLLNKMGPPDSMAPIRQAEISEKCPDQWKSPRWATGEKFFLAFAQFYTDLTLKQTIEQFLAAPPQAKLEYLKYISISETGDYTKISYKYPSPENAAESTEIWLDMSRGGAMTKIVTTHLAPPAENWSVMEDVVEEFTKVNGFWLPTKARRTFKNSRKTLTLDFAASNFATSDESANLYEVPLEPGTRVTDKRTNTAFVVGRGIDETLKAIESGLKK